MENKMEMENEIFLIHVRVAPFNYEVGVAHHKGWISWTCNIYKFSINAFL